MREQMSHLFYGSKPLNGCFEHLAQLFVLMNLLAFAFHTVCDSVEKLWQEARAVLGTRKGFFSDLHTITAYLLFPDWHALCSAMIPGNATPT